MPWHKITFSNAQVARGLLGAALDAFQKKMMRFGGDPEMVVFDSIDDEMTTTLYISPKMSLISQVELAQFSATESHAPTGVEPDLDVLVASDDNAAWSLVHQ